MSFKFDFRLLLLCLLLLVQLLLVAFYLLLNAPPISYTTSEPERYQEYQPSIKFVSSKPQVRSKEDTKLYVNKRKYRLAQETTKDYFSLVNGTLCFTQGTDIPYMQRFNARREGGRCECHQGWHGKDCGQPEVIWRAFMASREKLTLQRRDKPRKIIHGFSVNLEVTLAEINLNELSHVVDLFIVCESNYTESGEPKPLYFYNRLRGGHLKEIQHKILYVSMNFKQERGKANFIEMREYLWRESKSLIEDLNGDDLYVSMAVDEIPNSRALLFFKLYDGWPEPIAFRLRWSVFGFFWQHPQRTAIVPGGCSIQLLEGVYGDNPFKMTEDARGYQEGGSELPSHYLVIGDLNHFGGWYCNWCLEPKDIVATLQQSSTTANSVIKWDNVGSKIDVPFVEDLIGSGLWLDGTTQLLRKSQSRDSYFAPEYVLNNTWTFDFLLVNFYSKLDY
ncbi:beta-1,4-mannosyl-glycoprotein 4-beta-N-acetylglucosaminyltransferase-like [Ischnura elegans]|uniref:beta-1,4-mannosyl-glycoprotein 4-beta-N-acetylglucosaminyltransferase-like n=1 Tax=Ischnura elegans TaxID=197161 RepID=UPI001ED87BD5|nr:beta-1,4-mannosyl-glycoprotein 4-beta-N-acetylglucosaminyltransferase-like [Ischnura elegans]